MPSLILTKWDVKDAIYVPAGIVSNLQNYHFAGIRFLYDCYQNKLKGGILNHDVDMNFPAQISAFLTALKNEIREGSPALIICSENRYLKWLYHLKIYGNFTVHCAKECVSEDVNEEIIMTSVHETKALQSLTDRNFSFIVVEEFDLVSNKRIFKQLKGDFHIGLTTRNFIKEPNQKIFFEMINWTNPGVLGKFSQFCQYDTEHIQNFRWPYDKYWHRLTWDFCNTFKRPTVEEKKEYVERIELWAKQQKIEEHLLTHTNIPKRRKFNKVNPKEEQEEEQKDPLTSSESSMDVVETLGKKTNIRRKKRKVTPNKHVKGKSGKYVKKNDDNEISFRRTRDIENNLVEINYNSESNSEKKLSNLISQNGDIACLRKSPEFTLNALQSQKINRKRSLPLLDSSSSSAEGSQSDEDNSILWSLFKTEKMEEKNENSVNENEKTQSQLDLCMMLDQSIDEFEINLEKNQCNEDYDVLMSIISPKKDPQENLKNSEDGNCKKLEASKMAEKLSDKSNDSDFFETFQPKLIKNEFKEQILSLLSGLNSDDCDI